MSLDPANEREANDDGDLLIGKAHPQVDADEEPRASVALDDEELDSEELDEEDLDDEEDLADDGDLDFEPDDDGR